MFRQYDSDNTVWSPQGRLYQIEYAMEAIKRGGACVGARSKTHAVIAALKHQRSPLASYQNKIFAVDEHMGIAISGLTADARVLTKYMRRECINHRYVFESSFPVGRLVLQLSDKSQVHTQRYGRRPYGVGFLVAGYDQTGPHLFETCPSGNYSEYKAMAIGARSQACKTYLEKTFEEYENVDRDELIRHVITALREATGSQSEGLTSLNVSVGVVGPDESFHILDGAAVQPYLNMLEGDTRGHQEVEQPSETTDPEPDEKAMEV